jgi:hypothetical protein
MWFYSLVRVQVVLAGAGMNFDKSLWHKGEPIGYNLTGVTRPGEGLPRELEATFP